MLSMLRDHIHGTSALNQKTEQMLDYDANGVIDVYDMAMLKRKLDGLEIPEAAETEQISGE